MPSLSPPVPAIEFDVSSVGMSKGIAQTRGPQYLARGELAFGPVFVGAYAKNVDSSSYDGEAGALVGVRTTEAGFDLLATAAWKRAIDPAGSANADALEISASAARKLGRAALRLSAIWSPDDLGSTRQTLFAEAGASYRLTGTLSASAAVGRRQRGGGPDYDAWNAGMTWAPARPVSIDLRYYETDGGNSQPYRARVVLSARAKF